MTRYVLGRLGSGLVTLFLFVTLLFFLANLIIPGDYVSQFILTASGRCPPRPARHEPVSPRPVLDWLRSMATLDLVAFVLGGWLAYSDELTNWAR